MYYIGIDLGGTNIAAGLVAESGELISKKSVPTIAERGEDAIISDMAAVATELVKENNLTFDDIISVGIGSPGAVDAKGGVVVSACNLNFINTPLAEKFKKYINKDVYIENDANCAAWGEAMSGASKGAEDSVMITLGTGVGGGIISGGKIVNGFNGFGGELGHIIIEAGGRECGCGRRGCWEAYSSATALIKITQEFAQKDKDSYMWTLWKEKGRFSGKTAFKAADTGDSAAKAAVDYYLKYLTIGIFNVIQIFQPEIIVIGGGVSNEGDGLYVPLRQRVKDFTYFNTSVAEEKRSKIVRATLGGDAGIVGAALLGK